MSVTKEQMLSVLRTLVWGYDTYRRSDIPLSGWQKTAIDAIRYLVEKCAEGGQKGALPGDKYRPGGENQLEEAHGDVELRHGNAASLPPTPAPGPLSPEDEAACRSIQVIINAYQGRCFDVDAHKALDHIRKRLSGERP